MNEHTQPQSEPEPDIDDYLQSILDLVSALEQATNAAQRIVDWATQSGFRP